MATIQTVPEKEWEQHKDVLQNMYCVEKVPLQSRKGKENEPGVVELMRERYDFLASPSQYELQFKKWGLAKNLKSGEWEALISQYDLLCQAKTDVRIIVSGSVLSKHKIDRARRRYRPRNNRSRRARCESASIASVSPTKHSQADYDTGSILPASRQAHVEFLDESGEWHKYSGTQTCDSNALVLHKSSHTLEPASLKDAQLEHHAGLKAHKTDSDQDVAHNQRATGTVSPSHDLNQVYRPFSPPINFDDFLTIPMPYLESPSLARTHSFGVDDAFPWSLPLESNMINGPLEFSPFLETSVVSSLQDNVAPLNERQELGLGKSVTVSGTYKHLEGARTLINSLVQHGKMDQCYRMNHSTETEIPDVEDIMDSLESLLPETETTSQEISGLTLSIKDDPSSSKLFNTLIYSFINNFAGLRDVPRKSMMQLLREHHDIRTQLFEVIKSGQPGIAKPLADNLFRAAVEGCDADAVATIIHHTKSNPKIAIDPNEMVCKFGDKDYTPIELAAKFRNTELVRTLVASRADPNKTYGKELDEDWEKGALALALGHWVNGSKHPFKPSPPGEPEPASLDLLRLLLDCGAEVRMDLLENAMRPGRGHTAIAEELISRLPANDHQRCFQSKWLLISMVHYLENAAATRSVRRLFVNCDSTNCGKCPSSNRKLVEALLCHAARRSNIELSEFLVQHTSQLQSALAAAVRAGCDELVQLLLDSGAHVNDPVESYPARVSDPHGCFYDGMYDENGYDRPMFSKAPSEYVITPIRTPLAEAIRARNSHLINMFERLGGLTCLSNKHHFQAAVLAAVEAGNISYLKFILDHGSRPLEKTNLTLALAVAIRNDDTEAAVALLDAGASLYMYERRYGDPLVSALERRQKRVLESMLECDSYFRGRNHIDQKFAVEIAASWCEVDIIEDLVRLGFPMYHGLEMSPLAAAVRSKNETLVQHFLGLGAGRLECVASKEGVLSLRAALEMGDHDMVRFLVVNGVSPVDYSAFEYAIQHDSIGYEILLSEFKLQHPNDRRGFLGSLLSRAIELDSHSLLDSLLEAGADVNSWCGRRGFNPNRDYEDEPMDNKRVLGFAIKHHKGRRNELVRKFLNRGANPAHIVREYEVPYEDGPICVLETALVLAIKTRDLQLVSLLLEHGAELNRPARRGVKQTPLQAACETGSHKMVEFLIQRGANLNDAAAERHGGTALQMAAKTGSLKVVKLLLDNGADPHMDKPKVGGRTAFEAAAENGCLDILCLLWNAVLPFGFSDKECQSAKHFAKQKGHKGCVDFIDFLSGGSSQPFLD